jgi:monofunctional biosynthetic peptidoglycan transglycosylase
MTEPVPHTANGRRKRRAALALLLLSAAVVAWWLLRPRDELGERMARQLEQYAAAKSIPLSLDRVDSALLLGEGDLTGLVLGPVRLPSTPYEVTAKVKRAHVRLEPAGLIRGLVDLREVVLSGVEVSVTQAPAPAPERPRGAVPAKPAKAESRGGATPTLRLEGLTVRLDDATWNFDGLLPTADTKTTRSGKVTFAQFTGPATGAAQPGWQGRLRIEDSDGWAADGNLAQSDAEATRLVGSLFAPGQDQPLMQLSTGLARSEGGVTLNDLRWQLQASKKEQPEAWATVASMTASCERSDCTVSARELELVAEGRGHVRMREARVHRSGGDLDGLLRWGTAERGIDLQGSWLAKGDFTAKLSALQADPSAYVSRDTGALRCPPAILDGARLPGCGTDNWTRSLPIGGTLNGTLKVLGNGDGAEATGEGSLTGGRIAWKSLAAAPIEKLDGRLKLAGGWSWRDHKFWLEEATVTTGAAVVVLKGFGDLPGKGATGELSMHMEPVAVTALRDSLPEGMMPWLEGATMSGKVGFEALVRLDAASPGLAASQFELLEEELTLSHLAGISMPLFEEGRIVALPRPEGSAFPALREGSWAALRRLPRHVARTILAAEDDGFFNHRGFDWRGIQRAMAKDYAAGAFVAGGSTITQQVAKNLFLSSERSLSRKLQEMLLTYLLEHQLTKEEVLEVYLNTARFGRSVVGVEAAARHYFGHPAAALTQAESLALAVVLPAPARFGEQLEKRAFDDSRLEKLEHIVANLERDGSISERDAAYLRGLIERQQFSRQVVTPPEPVSQRELPTRALP